MGEGLVPGALRGDAGHGVGDDVAALGGLRAAISVVDLVPDGEVLAEARALLDALEARIALAEAEYARSGQAVVDGYPDLAAFFRHRCRATATDSRRMAARGRRLATWPVLGEAWRDGRLTGAQVTLAVRLVPERHVDRFTETLDDTVEILEPLTGPQTARVLSRWVDHADDAAQREDAEAGVVREPTEPERALSASRSLGDELVLNGVVDRDSAPFVEQALAAATRPDREGEQRTAQQRRADALVELCRSYLDRLDDPDGTRRREHLTVVSEIRTLYRAWLHGAGVRTADDLSAFLAEHPGLGELDRGLFLAAFDGEGPTATTLDGAPVSDALVAAAASGGVLELLLTADGRPLHLGCSVRVFSPAQRRALLALWQGCATCGAPPDRVHIHHVDPWDEGGCTDVGRGVPRCGCCHLDFHRKGWQDDIEPDGTYVVELPDGTRRRYRPPGADAEQLDLPVATAARKARPLVRDRAPVHEWTPYDEPEIAHVTRELLLAWVEEGDGHPLVVELQARLDALVEAAVA